MDVKRARVGYLGVMTGPVDESVRKELGLSADEGVLIPNLAGNGPAEAAGIQAGDILIRISGAPVNMATLRRQLTRIGAGEKVMVTVVRDGKRVEIELTLGQRPGRRR